MNLLHELLGRTISCREATKLVSQSQERPLPWHRALALRMHLRICSLCVRFDQQVRFLREAMRRYRE